MWNIYISTQEIFANFLEGFYSDIHVDINIYIVGEWMFEDGLITVLGFYY